LDTWETLDDDIKLAIPVRFRGGIQKISELIAPLESVSSKGKSRRLVTQLAAKKYGLTKQKWNSFSRRQKNIISRRYAKGERGSDALTKDLSDFIGVFW